ncbi:hypothetical protein Ae168Ps1_1247c [Pseudonocardia sp. Ae168_Ps1]|nr:hypothetical protein Ae168Ps1_1247c [Pseudonocardia sp. Ae168_Ps1]OLL87032.1 hypothetical protein Ae263Ps1_4087 [Pseudonocardia sp. Ae263_Ps1]OLL92937.1 hypothetical protein Ae356Ps1_2834c [Pseudonocardia sp. Ae356_Ps1]
MPGARADGAPGRDRAGEPDQSDPRVPGERAARADVAVHQAEHAVGQVEQLDQACWTGGSARTA